MTAYIISDFIVEEDYLFESFQAFMKTISIASDPQDLIEVEFPVLPSIGHEIDFSSFMDEDRFPEEYIKKCSSFTFIVSNLLWIRGNGNEAIPVILCAKKVD